MKFAVFPFLPEPYEKQTLSFDKSQQSFLD